MALFVQVKRPPHVDSLAEHAIETYVRKLMAYHPPSVQQVLAEWPSHNAWWPAWAELEALLPAPGWTPERALPPPQPKRKPRRREPDDRPWGPAERARFLETYRLAETELREPLRSTLLAIGRTITEREGIDLPGSTAAGVSW